MSGAPAIVLVAGVADAVPGILFGLPLVAVTSLVFAATRHESPEAIRAAALGWAAWIGGILGSVLAAVLVLGWLAGR